MFFDYNPLYPLFNIALVIYLPIVFGLKYFVDNYLSIEQKEHLSESLKLPWAAWCFGLSLFSLFGTYYTGKFLFFDGHSTNVFESDASFWYHAFAISKVPELLDTIFIVLRSKPLVPLQWYHHWATLAMIYYASSLQCNKILVCYFMNYFVHTFMYFYFGLYCFNQSKFLREVYGTFVNIIQTIQMFFGVIIGIIEYFNGIDSMICKYKPKLDEINVIFYFGLAMYFSYFFLFVQVFYDRSKRLSKSRDKKN